MEQVELPTAYQQYIHSSRYARWLEDAGRRETWEETVDRYFDYMRAHLSEKNDFKMDLTLQNDLKRGY